MMQGNKAAIDIWQKGKKVNNGHILNILCFGKSHHFHLKMVQWPRAAICNIFEMINPTWGNYVSDRLDDYLNCSFYLQWSISKYRLNEIFKEHDWIPWPDWRSI